MNFVKIDSKKYYFITLIVGILFVYSKFIFAQSSTPLKGISPTTSEVKIDVIVVTGTKTGKGLKEGPVKTEVLNQERIQDQHYRDVSEAILDIPGVTLSNVTGKQGKSAVMQGLGADHVLLVIDGVPVSQNSNGGFDLTQISTSDVRQLEVVKGGASALYGGQAMGGVINVITKKPTDKAKYGIEAIRDQYTEGTPKNDVGYNSLKGHFSKRYHNTAFKLNLTNNKSSSVERDKNSVARDTADLNKFMGNLWIEQKLDAKNSIYADYNQYIENNKSYSANLQPDSSYKEVHNIGEVEGRRLKIGQESNFSQSNLNVYGLYETINDTLSMGDDPTTSYDESLKTSKLIHRRVEAQSNFFLGEEHIGTVGVVYDDNHLQQETKTAFDATTTHTNIEVDDKKAQMIEAFAQDDWLLPYGNEIVTGVRYTKDQYFGDNFSPKINYSKTFEYGRDTSSVLRSSIGSGFRVPSLKERFYVLDHRSFAGYIVLGNDQLKPETSLSYQLGWELTKKNSYSLGINGFLNVVDGLIMTKEISTGTTERTFTYENVDSARIRGIELSGDYFYKEKLKLSQSFTYTRAENGNDGLIIPNRPYYLAQTTAKYSFRKAKIDLVYTFRYFGESYANTENTKKYESYNLSDFRLNYHYDNEWTYFFGVKNIFDVTRDPLKDNSDIFYDQRPALGRMILLGLVYGV